MNVFETDRINLKRIRADEVPSYTYISVFITPNSDFKFIIKMCNDGVFRPKVHSSSKPSTHGQSASDIKSPSSSLPSKSSIISRGPPIILIPNLWTGVISSVNVIELLGSSKYVSLEDKRNENAKRIPSQTLTRELPDGSKIDYKIVDDHRSLRPDEWDRVVAVFASGQKWQFKQCKWCTADCDPVELFQKVLGVHFCFDAIGVESSFIHTWNCHVLKINPTKTHLVAGAVNQFWGLLDDFIRLNKPGLLTSLPSSSETSNSSHKRKR